MGLHLVSNQECVYSIWLTIGASNQGIASYRGPAKVAPGPTFLPDDPAFCFAGFL